MLLLVDSRLPVANALKNIFIGAASAMTAIIYALLGSVDWVAAPSLAVGLLVGSNLGPRVARRMPARILRVIIALLGCALAIRLAVGT